MTKHRKDHRLRSVRLEAISRPFALGLLLAVAAASCGGDAESREDLEGEALTETPAPAAAPDAERRPATAPAPAPAAQPASPAPAPARVIPAGTLLTFEVREDVSTSSHNAGDSFALVLVGEATGQGGAALPAGSSARGTVTTSRPSTGPEDEALLAFRVNTVQVNGQQRAIQGQVESANVESSTRDSATRTGATIATGTAAGAIIGQILGRDTRSTIQGAAVGTVAGAVVALTTRGGHAALPAGSRITVRLDDDLVL